MINMVVAALGSEEEDLGTSIVETESEDRVQGNGDRRVWYLAPIFKMNIALIGSESFNTLFPTGA